MKNYPKLGIRPTIDGRQGGVRESLEEKTMALAKAVAELVSKNVRYSDGTPVQCVIADGTIGRVGESAACAEKFEREGVGATITVTSCWCYGAETMDMNPYWPKAVWGFNGTERPGAVYLAAVLAAHAQKGLPAFGIYGHDVQDLNDNSIPDDVAEKILRFAVAGRHHLAAVALQGSPALGGRRGRKARKAHVPHTRRLWLFHDDLFSAEAFVAFTDRDLYGLDAGGAQCGLHC